MLLDFIHLFHIVKVEYDVIFVVYLLHFYSSLGFRHFLLMCLLDICLPCSSVSIFAREGDCSSAISWMGFFMQLFASSFSVVSFHVLVKVSLLNYLKYIDFISKSSQHKHQRLFHKHLKTGEQVDLSSLLKQPGEVFLCK